MSIVQTLQGPVRGSRERYLDQHADVFKGIPYAEPISGRARWLPPQPRKPWSEVRDATRYGDACQQFGAGRPGYFPRARRRYFDAIRGKLHEGDDCLLVNVWTPTLDRHARLPVMVYVHGGGYTQGAAFDLYNAAPFAARGVVTVVIQYRLGPPGFLHGSGLFQGDFCADNRGFLDQVAALQWVRDNIAAFAGDAGNVTIFGESAGAISIYQLLASPLAKGLFRRAIAMGGMPGACAPAEDYHALTRDVLQDAGIRAGDEAALIALDASGLSALQKSIVRRSFSNKQPDRYGAISRTKAPFMGAAIGSGFTTQTALEQLRLNGGHGVDLMLGTCAADGRLFSLGSFLPKSLNARVFSNVLRGLVPQGDLAAVRRHYAQQPSESGPASVSERINNDAFFRMPTIASAEAHAHACPGRTWLYQVDYASPIAGLGAIHGIEVALMFGPSKAKVLIADDAETQALSKLMLDAWTTFAKTGVPSAPGLPQWPAYDLHTRGTMVFDRRTQLINDWGRPLRLYFAGASPSAASDASAGNLAQPA